MILRIYIISDKQLPVKQSAQQPSRFDQSQPEPGWIFIILVHLLTRHVEAIMKGSINKRILLQYLGSFI